jgi:hypothetical protein
MVDELNISGEVLLLCPQELLGTPLLSLSTRTIENFRLNHRQMSLVVIV